MIDQRDALSEQHEGIFYRAEFLPCSFQWLQEFFFQDVVMNSIRNRQLAIQTNHADWYRIGNCSSVFPEPATRIVLIASNDKGSTPSSQNHFRQQARAT